MDSMTAQTETVPGRADWPQLQLSTEDQLCSSYLVAHSDIFRKLVEVRAEGWKNPEGDTHFRNQRRTTDEADYEERKRFFRMMQRSGDHIQEATAALTLPTDPQILDLCMAPGGYTASALKYNTGAKVSAITLPREQGGHEVIVGYGWRDPRVEVHFSDITLFATEFGVTDIPKDHPDFRSLSTQRPWADKEFDLVFCDGQVLRTHDRLSYRQRCEAMRLSCSQLILAMQRIKTGGTLIMLLHKVDVFRTVQLLALFDKIASIQLFKPAKTHATRSSFYLIAKNVQPRNAEALAAVEGWKEAWRVATFPCFLDEDFQDVQAVDSTEVEDLLKIFGERVVELGNPIWQIQKDALGKAQWFRGEGKGAGLEEKDR